MNQTESLSLQLYYRLRKHVVRKQQKQAKERQQLSKPFEAGRDPLSLGKLLEATIEQQEWRDPLAMAELQLRWKEIVGLEIAAHAVPQDVTEDGVLLVTCDSTAWATQLRLMKQTLLEQISEKLGRSPVSDLKVNGPSAPSWKKGARSVPGRGPRDTYG